MTTLLNSINDEVKYKNTRLEYKKYNELLNILNYKVNIQKNLVKTY